MMTSKGVLILLGALVSSSAFASDINLTFCDTEKLRSQLIVKGDKAQYLTPKKSFNMTVIDRLSMDEDDLTKESRLAGEKLMGGEALVLENKVSDIGLTVMKGESGAAYLGLINMGVDVIGSTANCNKK
ncbi:hypothetical protein D3C87_445570 [compost metagenome]